AYRLMSVPLRTSSQHAMTPPPPSGTRTAAYWTPGSVAMGRPSIGQPGAIVPSASMCCMYTSMFVKEEFRKSAQAMNTPPAPSVQAWGDSWLSGAMHTGAPLGTHCASAPEAMSNIPKTVAVGQRGTLRLGDMLWTWRGGVSFVASGIGPRQPPTMIPVLV